MMRKLCEKVAKFYKNRGRHRIIVSENYMHRHYLLFNGNNKSNEDDSENKERFMKDYPLNAFLHNIRGSDEPVYHDHPWPYLTIILAGGYWEHTPILDAEGYVIGDSKKWYGAGSFRFAKPNHLHWLEMGTTSTWTLFIRFKRCNEWGFLPYMQKDKIPHTEWFNRQKEFGIKRGGM